MKIKRLFWLCSLACLCAVAQAAVLVHVEEEAPTTDLLFSVVPELNSNFNWNGTPNQRDVGQSFQSTQEGVVSSLTMRIANFTNASLGADFSLSVYETSAFNEAPLADKQISVQTGVLPGSMLTEGYLRFELDTPIQVVEDKWYTWIFSFASDTTSGATIGFAVGPGASFTTSWRAESGQRAPFGVSRI